MNKPPVIKSHLLISFLFISNIILAAAPVNDNCVNAAAITPATSYVAGTNLLTGQTLSGATVEGSGFASSCGGQTLSQDVWYKFVASSAFPIIAVNNLGTSWGTRLRIQLLTGSCGSFSELDCANNAPLTPAAALTIGTTYYIRILKSNLTAPTGVNWGFDISILGGSSRMAEVFKQTTLSGAGVLNDPWEITYGPDDYLYITESKGYKVYRMNPADGTKTTILDISPGSTFLPSPEDSLNVQFPISGAGTPNPWPQGGLAGLALHPKFMDPVSPKNYIYISYIHRSLGGSSPSGLFYRNKLVRFTYNTGTGKLGSPVVLCDTLPGSKDHNSQRMIIAPIVKGGTNYLFYGEGDMGAGQFENRTRVNNAQNINSYEGKILRFNLETDGDPGGDAWIPDGNPYSASSAVYSMGIRNNQGFAYDTALNILYGSSHGPFSDDEINIIEAGKNYGHPLVIGKADGNANGTTAGSAPKMTSPNNLGSSCPTITDEVAAAAAIPDYKDPLFTAYVNSVAFPSLKTLWDNTDGTNGSWPSEGWSGLDLYTNTVIPGWKKSLVAASLKWGRLVRLKMGANGTSTAPNNTVSDTVSYFGSINRYRDIAFAPNGKDIYVIMDKSTSSSGPSAQNPIAPACAGCLQRYTFLGYADAAGKSTIPAAIDITTAAINTPVAGTTVTVDVNNHNLWVPITGPDGNILAEIYPNGNDLGVVTSAFYINSGAIRQDPTGRRYLNRGFTITPSVQPILPSGSPLVKIRLYLTNAEYTALDANSASGVSALSDLLIRQNNDVSPAALVAPTTNFVPYVAAVHGTGGYVLQADINSLSSFYIGSNAVILPVTLFEFKGSLQNNAALLQWQTTSETNTSHFIVERSADGHNYQAIGSVTARGSSATTAKYEYTDYDVAKQSSSIIYYRLKIMDADGAYKYSGIVTITLPFITGKLSVFPNPAAEEVNVAVTVPADGKLQWKMIDNTGRVLMQNKTQLKKGNNLFSININKLPVGLYYLTVSGAGIEQQVKLQKL